MSQFIDYPPVSDRQLGFFIDSSRCSGCKACQVACKDKNNLDVGRRFRRVYEIKGGGFIPTGQGGMANNVYAYTLSISYNHCKDPVCTKNCPTTAMHKRPGDGIVRVNTYKCVAADIARGRAYTARHSSMHRPARCRNAISASIFRPPGNNRCVSQPVRWGRSSSARSMNYGRNTAVFVMFRGCQIPH